MDHGGSGHGGGSMAPPAMEHFPGCTMRMLWNSDYKSTCIVHPALKVHSVGTLLFYMLALFALGVFYEYYRLQPARLERQLRLSEDYKKSARAASTSSTDAARAPLLSDRESARTPPVFNAGGNLTTGQRALKSLLYTSNVAISFFLMLVVMTYNTYLIGSVLAGAFVGHFLFHDTSAVDADRGMACH